LTKPVMDHYAHTDEMLKNEFGLAARRIDDAAAMEPALKPGLAGAWHYDTDAHLRPDRLMAEWRRVLESRGVAIAEHCEVRSIARAGSRARAVGTARGEFAADAFVVAAGGGAARLDPERGCRLPIQPGKGYSITMPRPARCPSLPVIFEEHRVAVTPMRSGYRLGSTMEFAGYDATLNHRRLDLLRNAATHYLHEPAAEP